MPTDNQLMLQILAVLPDSSFSSLVENPTTRLDLELSIQHGDVSALLALCYAAWLAEEKGQQIADLHWRSLGQLASRLGERETLEAYWPARLEQPWAFAAAKPFVVLDERAFSALKERGGSVIAVAQALRDAGACEIDACRILRSLFGLSPGHAIVLFRAP